MQSKSCDGTIGECREKIIGNEKNKLKHAPISCENGTSPNFSSSMAPHEGTLYEKKPRVNVTKHQGLFICCSMAVRAVGCSHILVR